MEAPNIGKDASFVFTGSEALLSAEVMHNYNRSIASVFKSGWLQAAQGVRVLDFGAGMGSITAEFLVQTGVRPVALEIDKTLADIVRRRGFNVIDTLSAVPLGALDLVFSSNVLEHIEDDAATIRQIFSVLRPGGVLALYVPAFPLLYTSYDQQIGHVRRYSQDELLSKLVAAGFVVLEHSYADCVGFLAALGYKICRGTSQQSPTRGQLRAFDKIFTLSKLLDNLGAKHLFGKNLAAIARKPSR